MRCDFISKKALLFLVIFALAFTLFVGCSAEKKTAAAIPHPIEGKSQADCLACHEQGVSGATKMPHEARPNCTDCHKPEK